MRSSHSCRPAGAGSMLLQCRQNASASLFCSSHPHNNRTQALKVGRPSLCLPPVQPSLFSSSLHPLARARDSTLLVLSFSFCPPPPVSSASSLSESAISHLWLRFYNSYCHISLVSFSSLGCRTLN